MNLCKVCRKNRTEEFYCSDECKLAHKLHGSKRYNEERERFEVFNCYTQRTEGAHPFTLEDGSVVVRYTSPQGAWVHDVLAEY